MAKSKAPRSVGLTEFEKDLLESVKQAQRGEGRVTKVAMTATTRRG